MKSSRFAELMAIIGFVIGCVIMSNAEGNLFRFGVVIAIGSIVWYFTWGDKLSGWVGPTEDEMQVQLRQVDQEIKVVATEPDGPDRYKKEAALLNKKIALERKQHEFGTATSLLTVRAVPASVLKTGGMEATSASTLLAQNASYTYAIELMEATGGYMDIFRRGTDEQQARKLDEITGHMDELKEIDSWFEGIKQMTVEERVSLENLAKKRMARKIEILVQTFKPF